MHKLNPSQLSGLNFFEPTILADVSEDSLASQTEIFGPVAPIMRFSSEEEVIKAANSSDVGLVSYLFTRDINRATRVLEQLHFGMVSLNTGAIPDAGSP